MPGATHHRSAIGLAVSLALVAFAFSHPAMSDQLKAPEDFAGSGDQVARSIDVFREIGRVLQHPRCVNCHPRGDSPLQGDDMRKHEPPVRRGEANIGVVGMRCTTCHQAKNIDHANLPGHPKWHLAPVEMAWEGKSLGEICRQISDPARNGGLSMDALLKHMAEDDLVGWGWKPDAGRMPVPGSQEQFGKLFAYWIKTGAHCPG
ncbi:MAG: Isoquinoline 1-oxidoreductase subunit [Hyphomicrobiaceae bacterium]|nr:Isoquinoline 1-oxidoreductase subunit [Hyphomicrobiaceae bacterium]